MGRGAYPGPVSEVDPAVARAVACVSRPRGTCRHESGAALSGLTHGGDCRSARPGRWRQAGRLRQIVDAGSVKIREAGLRYRSQGREEAWSRVRRDGATGVNFLRGRQPDAENQEGGDQGTKAWTVHHGSVDCRKSTTSTHQTDRCEDLHRCSSRAAVDEARQGLPGQRAGEETRRAIVMGSAVAGSQDIEEPVGALPPVGAMATWATGYRDSIRIFLI